jgi:2-polyprenyl-6-methoxyphenol hydroxylase-like FAD-dependent oxidoreductase
LLYDVLIAGGGPVGLLLACELRLAGCSVLVLEQTENPHSPLKRLPFGMRGLSAPSIEALYRRDLLQEVTDRQRANDDPARNAAAAHWKNLPRQPGGHFAGIQFYLDKVDDSAWPHRLPGPAGVSMMVDMASLESVLADRAQALGAEIERGCRVEDVQQADEWVNIRAGTDTFQARWLVGCDGARSAVRKAAGFEFAGTDPEFTGYSIDVELADTGALRPGRHYTATGMYTYAPPGTVGMVEFDGGAYHRSQPITLDHVQAVLRRVSGTDVTVMALRLATTWTDRAYQAVTYRNGRVLLAGDAAHTHSPLGGQGLNLGLGDAMNLGWKLAATCRGDAPSDLLDTYANERMPIGAQVLEWSRAQVALMRPSRSSRALEAIIRDLIDTPDGATYFAGRVWGVCLRYDLGDSHPLQGRSAPDIELIDGTRVGELLRPGKGLLLDFDASAPLQKLARSWNERVIHVASDAKTTLGLSALLVRPDGIVAWAADAALDTESASRAMSRWFGKPQSG